ncbi:hypothetical protein FJY68_11505 [candidate division WOR-3 bacterium]|uniref:Uncharacterized protein n=1 Tax=candidate division WOR-3 bacterium TaxID=2052148 RepID=A0A937XG15_UNCW3|nr:hypothetical protein [candidate division WOR-3 bacterium]
MARLRCPSCSSENTWAKYIHDPCPGAPAGKTEWEAEAEGATPTGTPYPKPCPHPNDGTMTNAASVTCHDCNNQW